MGQVGVAKQQQVRFPIDALDQLEQGAVAREAHTDAAARALLPLDGGPQEARECRNVGEYGVAVHAEVCRKSAYTLFGVIVEALGKRDMPRDAAFDMPVELHSASIAEYS